jgi:hypothetical protein
VWEPGEEYRTGMLACQPSLIVDLLSSSIGTSRRLPPRSFLLPFLIPPKKDRLVSVQTVSPASAARRPQSSMRYSLGSLASLATCLSGNAGRLGRGGDDTELAWADGRRKENDLR